MNRARKVELMSKLLELKIRSYHKIVHDHNQANKHFFDELLVLIQRCEEHYKSVVKAPDDSSEWQVIMRKQAEQPILHFRSRKMGDMSAREAAEIHQEVIELYNRGYPTATIAHILGIRASTVSSTMANYRHKIKSQNARKVKS